MERNQLEPRHLGDGVYVHDEGHGLRLAVNHHLNKVIYMEPEVIQALINYANECKMINTKNNERI